MNGVFFDLDGPLHFRYVPFDRSVVPVRYRPFCCAWCGIKSTPMQRWGPTGRNTLCNACGLRWRKDQRQRRSLMKRSIDNTTVVGPSFSPWLEKMDHEENNIEEKPKSPNKMAVSNLLN